MMPGERKEITDLQQEEIDVQRAILKAINRWQITTLYIAVLLTIAMLVYVTNG
jgi:hypothetical protein